MSAEEIKKQVLFEKTKCMLCGKYIKACKNGVFTISGKEANERCQERIVEYVYGIVKNKPFLCINFVNNITHLCDCYNQHQKNLIKDIGILVSTDPIAIDQASVDLINKEAGKDFFTSLFPTIDWSVQLQYGEVLQLGTRKYDLINY